MVVVVAAACSDDAPCAGEWTPVFAGATELDRSVLSAWGGAQGDVYLVGGAVGLPGVGALATRWDGQAWGELSVGREGTLWWVWGAPGEATDVWMVGEGGLVLRWDGATLTEVPSGTTTTLWGVWGTSSEDVWIVGGGPVDAPGEDDVVLHWDGQTLARDPAIGAKGVALYKVWGSGADDLWVVGEAGTIWRRRAGAWEDWSDPDLTPYTLFTVHGCGADEVYAVGGQRLLGFDGSGWRQLDVPLATGANGVSCGADGVLIVGNGGLKVRFDRAAAAWIDDQFAEPWDTDFHGALVTPEGSMWAVGGNFIAGTSASERTGVVAYFGCTPSRP